MDIDACSIHNKTDFRSSSSCRKRCSKEGLLRDFLTENRGISALLSWTNSDSRSTKETSPNIVNINT